MSTNLEPLVYIVDDDDAVRDALGLLLDSVNIQNISYASATAFLTALQNQDLSQIMGCIVMDIRMPGISGMDCQQKLRAFPCNFPIIFITGHGDVPMAVEAMKRGAAEFIQKPFREQVLLDCIQNALVTYQQSQQALEYANQIKARLQTLTNREEQVLHGIINGQANKVIANELNLSQRTIDIHRANVMEKMQAKSLAELVTMVLTQE